MSEFAIIKQYFSSIQAIDNPNIALGIGDDAAILNIPPGQQCIVSTDTMNVGRHFPEHAPAKAIAYRAVAAAVSDLAAMAANPLAFTLSVSLPDVDKAWLSAFSAGLAMASKGFNIALVGGDTTKGPLSIAVQVMGYAPVGGTIQRCGAQLGDDIYVSHYLGDAALALPVVLGKKSYQQDDEYLFQQFYYPQAQVELGLALRGFAHSMIDVSDGLLSDLGHIAERSDCAVKLSAADLPYSACLKRNTTVQEAMMLALVGGDDYQLCFSAPKSNAVNIKAISQQLSIPLTKVGEVEEGAGVYCVDEAGQVLGIHEQGFDHFSS